MTVAPAHVADDVNGAVALRTAEVFLPYTRWTDTECSGVLENRVDVQRPGIVPNWIRKKI